MVYLIHFSKPLHHARHYIGYCEDGKLKNRLFHHRSGSGSKILRACNRNKINYKVVRVWNGKDGNFERRLKNEQSKNLCPICNKKGWKNFGNAK